MTFAYCRSWFLDGRTIARNVKTTGLPSIHQIKDCEASFECPQCGYRIDDYNNVRHQFLIVINFNVE